MSSINNPLLVPTQEALNIVPNVARRISYDNNVTYLPELPEHLSSSQVEHILNKSNVRGLRKYKNVKESNVKIKELKKFKIDKEPLIVKDIKNNNENNNTLDVIAQDLGVRDATYGRLRFSDKLLYIIGATGFGLTVVTSLGIITAIYLNYNSNTLEIKKE